VPRFIPTIPAGRDAYRSKLPPKQRSQFDNLCKIVGAPRAELAWYHALGEATSTLRGTGPHHRERWFRDLAGGLGLSESVLQKAFKFAAQYSADDLERLDGIKADWSRLTLVFPLEDHQERMKLIRDAVLEKWPAERLKEEVRRRKPTGRAGVGGRRHSPPKGLGPEAVLRRLLSLTGQWVAVYRHAGKGVTERALRALLREAGDDRLKDAINELRDGLEQLAGQVGSLASLLKSVLSQDAATPRRR
jgi:hypothetical protein